VLGDTFRVHTCEFNYYGSHIDTSIVALRPGLLLCNPERVSREMLPPFLREWEIIFSPKLIDPYNRDQSYIGSCLGSKWMGMNLLSVRPDLVIADKHQVDLIRLLETYKINTIPLELRHSRMLGGGFHCVTVDIRRRAHAPTTYRS
jgi:N-dimethylarginine dimethylaminohydrolase